MALQTPKQPRESGILRSPHTPGTGSSVKFGVRVYEDGEESLLTASLSSVQSRTALVEEAAWSKSMELADRDERAGTMHVSEGESMEMSFTESFLKREVGDALAGLDASTSFSRHESSLPPQTPGRMQLGDTPDTIRPARMVHVDDLDHSEDTSSPDVSAHPGPLGMQRRASYSSPTVRVLREREDEDAFAPAPAPAPAAVGALEELSRDEAREVASGNEAQDNVDNETAPNDADAVQNVFEEYTLPVHASLPQTPSPASHTSAPADTVAPERTDAATLPNTPSSALELHRPSPPSSNKMSSKSPYAATASKDSSFTSSFYSFSTSPELSYLSEKEELEEDEAHRLIPFDVRELSTKLISIEKLGGVDAHELFETVAALDRTHSERTVFLHHRLARSHRQNQLLRANLQEAHGKIQLFETQLLDFVRNREQRDDATHVPMQAQLESFTTRLEEQLRITAPTDELEEERESLAMQRRDLEIRMATAPTDQTDGVAVDEMERRIAAAVAQTKEMCSRDADIRVHMARQASDTEALHAQISALQAAREAAEIDMERERAEWHTQDCERHEALLQAEARRDELEAHVAEEAEAILHLSAAKQEASAELLATVHTLRGRISALEHDVAHRGLEIVKLEKQCDRLSKEALNFSLALSAKQQEVDMLKRGTQRAPAYWELLAQRPRRANRAALGSVTNRTEHASTPNQPSGKKESVHTALRRTDISELSTSTIASERFSRSSRIDAQYEE
ncbi:hypothetical protein MVES1_003182 [Malassezia vespertilionis]|uniref:Uncharacterized protein n=1 Tax=Malassezia vespertilionis TaxID=2020962 RepID=A0A2N1J8V9_9BASI|nr:uncharacterized protein MVES1_003182 [Malassezia vespertilionis]PKI83000.1 hypothetical protein MVES_003021 [Malassezia vespertilionis]WFD07811.1 hypothetical protein MVES1_003182 [Malassezia vespertilionis]